MKKLASLSLSFLLLLFLASCSAYGFFWGQFAEDDVDERSPSMKNLGTLDLSSQKLQVSSTYSFLVFTDSHFGSEREELDEGAFLAWLDDWFKKYSEGEDKDLTKIPRFAVNLGDTADGGKEEQFKEYLRFEEKIKTLAGKYLSFENEPSSAFKVYSILGNHDLYHKGQSHFMKLIYPHTSSYILNIDADSKDSWPGFSYYFLDSANGSLGTKQLVDFKKKAGDDPRPKIAFSHYPIYAGGSDMFMLIQNTLERNTILTYFSKSNVRQVYEGHAHSDYGFDFEKFREDVIGSLRFTHRAEKQCAIVTVNEVSQQVHTEIVKFN